MRTSILLFVLGLATLGGLQLPGPGAPAASGLEANGATLVPPAGIALAGDANCDGTRNSIDALLVFQFEAGLIRSLRCLEAADSNADGRIDATDAALILQYDAGLIVVQ